VAVQDEAELKSGMGTVRKINDTIPTLNFFENVLHFTLITYNLSLGLYSIMIFCSYM